MRYNKKIFWDVNPDKLDEEEEYATFIIERVFNRGDIDDIMQCRRYYGDKKVKDVLVNTRYISKERLYLISAIFDTPLSNFKCYTLMQSNPELYPY